MVRAKIPRIKRKEICLKRKFLLESKLNFLCDFLRNFLVLDGMWQQTNKTRTKLVGI